jgi:N-methylhydantoinase B
MPRISEMPDTVFDGITYPYVPPKELRIAPQLKLHRRWREEIDPITYEVIRHNLWHINEEHGAMIQRISGSPVAMYALDLNPSILTEDAEFVYFGPYMQYMSGVADTQVKWILENRSENPGLRDGDMFLANDPWVGAAHQMDVMLICPVFHEGELFCWLTNCLHQYDIGGITPGSFCPAAESSFDEGILIPPIKIIEDNRIREDIEALYLRSSRKPEMVALDFRAQMAGNNIAKERVHKLIHRYGAATVKGVMKRIIDNGEQSFLEKMGRLPDGVWQERTYVESCRPGDRRIHRVMLTLRKQGDTLVFENEGTAPQDGAMNATYSGWRGSILVALNELLCWDQYFGIGGALRHVAFDPTPGTFTCATHPASVSTAPTQAMEISLYPAYNVISKLMFSDPELRKDIMCIGGTSQWPATIFRGVDQHGELYGYLLIDPICGAIGAFAHGDGISTGGQSRTPICKMPNIEHTEQNFPLLFLYRKELVDSGGAGKFRGGLSGESCFIPHNTVCVIQDTLASGCATPTTLGMMGGYPSTTNGYTFVTDSDIAERFAERRMPEDASELNGSVVTLQLRQENFVQNSADVYAVRWCGGGGFGDRMDRDRARVAHDYEHLTVSCDAAREIYGVVLDPETGVADLTATAALRDQVRAARVARYGKSATKRPGQTLLRAMENLVVKENGEEKFMACAACDTFVGGVAENYKDYCIREEHPVSAANPLIGEPKEFIDDDVEFRQFFCPGCGRLIENEVAAKRDPVLQDFQVHV